MKFSKKDIKVEFLGWKLVFKRISSKRLQSYMTLNSPIKKDQIEGDQVDTKKLSPEQLDFLLNSEIRFLASVLISADQEDAETFETQEEKEFLINCLMDESDEFKEWATGYIQGEKKT